MQLKKDRTSKGGKVGNIKTLTQQTKRRLLLRCQCLTAFPSTTHLQKKPCWSQAGIKKATRIKLTFILELELCHRLTRKFALSGIR